MGIAEPPKNTPDTEIPRRQLLAGALALFLEIAISMGLAGLIKQISADISLFTILFCRYLFCLPLLLWLGWYQRGRALFRVRQQKVLAIRILAGMAGISSWFVAVSYLPISLATVLGALLTIFITLLAPFLLNEVVGRRRLIAVIFGFSGVLFLINPFAEQTGTLSLIGIIAGLAMPFFAALMFIFLRRLGRSEAAISTTLWYNGVGTLLFAVIMLGTNASFPAMTAENSFIWFVLIFAGVGSSFQQFLMAWSHELVPASALAPIHYSAVPISIFIGIVFFDEEMTVNFILGTSIIIGSAWYIFNRERARNITR
ncbi:MAG: DMT family transporter [Candidatus Puniceispirillaceae bacterium]